MWSFLAIQVVKVLWTTVENYSGWRWLHKDPQIPEETLARTRLHEITKPTHIIVGEGDLSHFHNISDVLGEISSARKVIVPNAGHGEYGGIR